MDPIRNKITPNTGNIQGPQQTSAAGPAQGTGKKFDVGSATGPTGAQGAEQTQSIGRPTFDDMASFIKDAASKSMSRDQVRDGLIEHETKKTFGDEASPQLTAAVSDAFAS